MTDDHSTYRKGRSALIAWTLILLTAGGGGWLYLRTQVAILRLERMGFDVGWLREFTYGGYQVSALRSSINDSDLLELRASLHRVAPTHLFLSGTSVTSEIADVIW